MNNNIPIPVAIFDSRQQIKEQLFPLNPAYQVIDGVEQDFEQAKQFLISYSSNQDTFNAYRREL